jgi:hypothetical protein
MELKENLTVWLTGILALWLAAAVQSPAADFTAHFVYTNAFCEDYDETGCCTNYTGYWSDPGVWDIGQVPNNSGGDNCDVIWDGSSCPCSQCSCLLYLDLGTNVFIRNFTLAASGMLLSQWSSSLAIQGDLDWSKGSIGAMDLAVLGTARLHATAPDVLELRVRTLTLGGASTLACGVGGGFDPGWPNTWLINAPGATLSILEGAALTNGIGFKNYGTCRIVSGSGEFRVGLIQNYGLLEVNNRTVRLDASLNSSAGALEQHAGTLQLNGGRIVSQPVSVYGGRLLGQGEVEEADFFVAGDCGLGGQITFSRLGFGSKAKMAVTLGGSEAGDYDQFTIREWVDLGGTLEITFTNGFENRIGSGDAIEIFKLASGATVSGQFGNVKLGQRFNTADGRGSFLWTNSGGSLALRDFASSGPRLEFTSGSVTYPFPPTSCYLASGATLSAGSGATWAGGRLTLQVVSGIAVEDRLEVQSRGEGPGEIGVTWNPGSPDNGSVRFGGVKFATVHRLGAAELVLDFESSAATGAIEALLRQLLYVNTVFSADAFTDTSVGFPTRTMQLVLTDGAGHPAIVNRQIEFPALTGLYLNPSSVTVLFDWSCLDCSPYAVGSADVVVMGTFSATVGWQPLSFWRTAWSDDCGGHW